MRYRNWLALLLGIVNYGSASAQQLPFVLYTPKDGLASNRVRSAFQDSRGRMYFVTFGGLSVYDGVRFTNYSTEQGLLVDVVNDVIEMGTDSLWVAVNSNKVHCLVRGVVSDLKTADDFHPLINRFFKSTNGQLYGLGDEGLFLFHDGRFIELPFVTTHGSDVGANLISILEVNGLFLVQTDFELHNPRGALYLYDPVRRKVLAQQNEPHIFFATRTPKDEIWICTSRGLRMLDKDALTATGTLSIKPLPPPFRHLSDTITHYVFFDKSGLMWWKSKDHLFKTERNGKTTPVMSGHGWISGNLHSIFQDKEATLWFCTEDIGVEKLVNTHIEYYQNFSGVNRIEDVCIDKRTDSIWMYGRLTRKIMISDDNQIKTFSVSGKYFDATHIIPEDKGVWLFGSQQAMWLTLNNRTYTQRYAYEDTTSSHTILRPIVDPYGNIITAGSNRLTVFSRGRKIFDFPVEYLADQVSFDSKNRAWVVTRSNKLLVFSIHPDQPERYLQPIKVFSKELPSRDFRSIIVDTNDNIWLGTRFEGLYALQMDNLEVKSWKHFSAKNGLTENFVSYLFCDRSNTIWVCTPSGLDNIERTRHGFQVTNVTKSGNIYQYVGKITEDKAGVKWALTTTGIIKIHPKPAQPSGAAPELLITELRVGNQVSRNLHNGMQFSHSENNLGFNIAVPSFYDEKQIRYSYLLKGSNLNTWSNPTSNATVDLVNLPPGDYELRVKAIFPASRYPDQFASFAFSIIPPWWQTWWFQALLGICTAAILVLVIMSYSRKKLIEQRKALEKQQTIEKERTRIALDMHDDLGAGLSTIRFLSDKVRRNGLNNAKADIERMALVSDELVENMNEIIWAMNEKNDSLEDLLFYTRSYAKEYCEENRLRCEFDFPERIPSEFVTGELRRNVFLTVKESLHNIVKHAHASNVYIAVKVDHDLHLTIRDDGEGINKSDNLWGNGLRNMSKRIESLGGRLAILNQNGVCIQIQIPYRKLHP